MNKINLFYKKQVKMFYSVPMYSNGKLKKNTNTHTRLHTVQQMFHNAQYNLKLLLHAVRHD